MSQAGTSKAALSIRVLHFMFCMLFNPLHEGARWVLSPPLHFLAAAAILRGSIDGVAAAILDLATMKARDMIF